MPILSGDVKLLKSANMTDVPEGGGAPTGIEIADGVSNAIFPDISELDRAGGRVSLRKVFPSVKTDDRDTYFGANIIVAEPPKDPLVSVTLFSSGSTFDTRVQAASRVESYLNKGPEWSGFLYENHIAGQRVIQLFQRPNDVLPNVGQTLCLVQDEGLSTQKEQYVRATAVGSVTRTFTYGEAQDYQAAIVTVDISDALRTDFAGSPATRTFARLTNATKTRDTVVADAGTYVGVSPLVATAAIGDFTVSAQSMFTQLVPSAQTETPISDIRMNGLSAALVATGGPLTRTLTLGFTTTQSMHVGGPIYPGSLSIARSGVTLTDSGGRLVNAGAQVGTVDYDNGIAMLSADVFGAGAGSHEVTFTPAEFPDMISEQSVMPITIESRSLSYAFTLGTPPLPRTTNVAYLAQGRWYVLRDDGSGRLIGNDSSHGAGTVNYITGSVVVTLGALPDVGSALVVQSYSASVQIRASNVDLSNSGKAYIPINTSGLISEEAGTKVITPGALSIGWTDGGSKLATDNGLGQLTGDATGTVDYSAGVVRISPNVLPPKGTSILLDTTSNIGVIAPSVNLASGSIGAANIEPGSVSFTGDVDFYYTWSAQGDQWAAGSATQTEGWRFFDRAGKLYGLPAAVAAGVKEVECGTINYTTGNFALSLPPGLVPLFAQGPLLQS